MSKHKKRNQQIQEPLRKVDQQFNHLDRVFTNPENRGPYAIFLFLAFFGVMGLIWMIPFPQFDFLVRMNMHTFLNWGSLFIAIVIYSYLKMAPTLSYAVLLCIGIMSFFIVQLEYVERDGGPAVWLVCLLIAAISLFVLRLLNGREGKHVSNADYGKLLILGPIWMWSKVFGKMNWKY